jgi:hypothetical protein
MGFCERRFASEIFCRLIIFAQNLIRQLGCAKYFYSIHDAMPGS